MCVVVVWGVSLDPKHSFEIFPHLQKHDTLRVDIGHGIFKLIFLKNAKQTGK